MGGRVLTITSFKSSIDDNSSSGVKTAQKQKPVVGPCYYCKQDGHRMSDCVKLKKRKEKEGLDTRKTVPNALSSIQMDNEIVIDHYKPFMSTCFVNLVGCVNS